ncbi:DNA helicase [Vibrio phage EniLVp02]
MKQYDIRITHQNHSYCKVIASDNIIREMYDYFSFHIEGYKFNPKYKYGLWDGKIRLIGLDGTCPRGLVKQVAYFAKLYEYSCTADKELFPTPAFESIDDCRDWIASHDIYSGNTKITPHWYQSEAVFRALNRNRAILNLPTSSGKSLIQALLSKWYCEHQSDKILILVPTTQLVLQMIDDFTDYRLFNRDDMLGIKAGTMKDSKARIYVSTWQSAVKQGQEWFNQFGMLLADEVHLATGTSISSIIKKMKYCPYKIGLSGSLRDGKANMLQYVGLFGEIYAPVTTRQLMDEGQIADLGINIMKLSYSQEERKLAKKMTYDKEIAMLATHSLRNAFICRLAAKLANGDQNVLMTFRHKKQGELLLAAMKKLLGDDRVSYVTGDVKTESRNEIKLGAEDKKGIVIVASLGVFSTGVSIKNLHHVFLCAPIKSKITVVQTIGRSLRKHASKAKAILWDFVDDLRVKSTRKNAKKPYSYENYAFQHGTARTERYIMEEFDYQIKEVTIS